MLTRNGEPVPGRFDWVVVDGFSPDRIVTFPPAVPLFHATTYTLRIEATAVDRDTPPKSLAAAFESTFTTDPDPVSGRFDWYDGGPGPIGRVAPYCFTSTESRYSASSTSLRN